MGEILYNRCDGMIIKLNKIGEKQYIDQNGIVIDLNKCAILGKTSHNIIDLIEVGDFVNGFKVYNYFGELVLSEPFTELHTYIKDIDIKSIVTKEQFKSVSYEV